MPIIYTFVYCLDLYTDIYLVKKPKRRPEEEYMQCTCARSEDQGNHARESVFAGA